MESVKLVWGTENADNIMGYCARVSNPANQDNPNVAKLLQYCMEHGHVSIFEMANACLEINLTRDIGRQLLRHRSFCFQEFSQRYASVDELAEREEIYRECRLQDEKNRQNSIENTDEDLDYWWRYSQSSLNDYANSLYREALKNGIAKEQARALLPEGLTPSRMYVNGTMRSWIFYLKQRLHPSTQKEHRLIAEEVLHVLRGAAPITMSAFFPEDNGLPV